MQHKIAYYITPHGFGHAVRSFVVIEELRKIQPGIEFVIVSDLPDILIQQNLGETISQRRRRLDIGLVQLDSLRFDLAASKEELLDLHRNREALVAEEVSFFRDQQITAVVCDIPFLPLVAASRSGLATVGIGNFTWDWIYRALAASDPEWQPSVSWIQQSYSHCGLFLQLPMHGDCSICPRVREVPLVARRARHTPDAVRTILGMSAAQKMVLISFSHLQLEASAQQRLEKMREVVFLYKKPLHFSFANSCCVENQALSYADLVAAVNGVVTKPGYGIVADCLSHGTPMIYTDRGPFPEYEILVRTMTEHLPVVFLPSGDLYSGNWETAIGQLPDKTGRRPQIRLDGGRMCAETILAYLGWL